LKNSLDTVAIKNFLTIRYDNRQKSQILPVTPSNFSKPVFDSNGLKTEKLLESSLKQHFSENDEPISLSLSGGIDSTLILGLLRKIFPKRKIFAICGIFENAYDESIIAQKVAEKFDADFKIVQMDSIFSYMPKIISITKKPKWNTYTHLIAKEAKNYSKNFVTGDGADEVFGGYTFRYQKFLNLLPKKYTWKKKVINYLECHNRDWVPDQKDMFNKKIQFDWNELYSIFKVFFNNKLEPLQQVMLADFNGKLLYDFIPLGNSISNFYKLKNFSPFLDKNVVSFGLKLPISQKYNVEKNKGKVTLRKISSRLGVKHIDEKRGFSPNILFDWKKNGQQICKSILLEKNCTIYKKQLINYDWVIRSFEKIENDGNIRYMNRMISVLALELWFRIFVTKDINPNNKL
jgi:asparagine synthase (glutamine-hydrolysing)